MTSRSLLLILIASFAFGAMVRPAFAAEVADARGEVRSSSAQVTKQLRTSDAEKLFRGKIPRVSDFDGHYDSMRGMNADRRDRRLQCRGFWNRLRAKPVETRPIQANLATIHANARRLNLALGKVDRALGVFLKNQSSLPNQRYVSIIDFDKPSKSKRLFSIDLRSGQIESFNVAAGRGSDPSAGGFATQFSNVGGSLASSLGCYVGFGGYFGKFGRPSLALHGIEKTNSNACDREIVIHPAGYVGGAAGRSEGCPAVQPRDLKKVFDHVGGGGLICAYRDGASSVAPDRPAHRRHAHRYAHGHHGHRHHARHTRRFHEAY